MKIQNILWDFNGTILDDVQIGIDAVNVLLRRRNKPEIPSLAAYQQIFGFPVVDYYIRAGFDFTQEPYERVAPEWVSEYLARESLATVSPEVFQALDAFRGAGLRQFIVSVSELEMLKKQVAAHGLAGYFDGLYGLDNIHGGSKAAVVCGLARSLHGPAIMLGDTVHDAECAAEAKIPIILIAAGHQSFEKLSETGCPTVHTAMEACRMILGDV